MFGCLGRIGWGLGAILYGLAQFDDEYYRLSKANPKQNATRDDLLEVITHLLGHKHDNKR